jgi:hypothetical protein
MMARADVESKQGVENFSKCSDIPPIPVAEGKGNVFVGHDP